MTYKVTSIACGALLTLAGLVVAPAVCANEFNQASQFTLQWPLKLPGSQVLAAGTYWFVLDQPAKDPNRVRILDSDRKNVVATVESSPTARGDISSHSTLTLVQPSGDQPSMLLDWYYAGSVSGHHLNYPTRMQGAFSKQPRASIEANYVPAFYDGHAEYPEEVSLQGADDVMEAGLTQTVVAGGIPRNLLDRARCLMVAAEVPNNAFMSGATLENAVVVCRTGAEVSGPWGAPVMYELSGGKLGAATTSEYRDYVLLVMNSRAMERVLSGEMVRLGADISSAAGPASASVGDERFADVLTYAGDMGALSGESLGDSTLAPNQKANRKFYGVESTAAGIAGEPAVESPQAGQPLVAWLNRQVPRRNS